ncbi:family B DNA polymerase, partial [Pseudomonas aeruginosa]|uniref:family B DNA polymerase n=1 Tax=Pseudomonas aeruginosa TaxID=287 RepID=UPI002B271583
MSAFLKSSIPPTDIYSVKELVRENVMTSDTDACIYSVDQLIQEFSTDPTVSLRFNGVLTFFIRNIAIDQHAKLSRNMNVAKKYE